MSSFDRILCPIDLSENSKAAIDTASRLALQSGKKLVFFLVQPDRTVDRVVLGSKMVNEALDEERAEFEKICPSKPGVDFEHVVIEGNPGPMIANASATVDMVVMGTHGRSGLARLLMGSVAQYVVRHAKCPVLMVKRPQIIAEVPPEHEGSLEPFVTSLMHHVKPVHTFEQMEAVVDELGSVNESAAPVVDCEGRCIGILTTTDIDQFQSLKQRFEMQDPSVVQEMFEFDEYGLARVNDDFEQVERHMTKSPIAVFEGDRLGDAVQRFDEHPDIHHLVVLDGERKAIGILNKDQVMAAAEKQTRPV